MKRGFLNLETDLQLRLLLAGSVETAPNIANFLIHFRFSFIYLLWDSRTTLLLLLQFFIT